MEEQAGREGQGQPRREAAAMCWTGSLCIGFDNTVAGMWWCISVRVPVCFTYHPSPSSPAFLPACSARFRLDGSLRTCQSGSQWTP